MILIDHNTKGNKQGTIKYVLETRIFVPIRVLNLPKAENQPLNRSLGVHLFQVWTGAWAIFFILSVISFMTFFFFNH
jgi:hypothetical protein